MSHTYIVPVTFLTFLKAVMSLVQKRTSGLQKCVKIMWEHGLRLTGVPRYVTGMLVARLGFYFVCWDLLAPCDISRQQLVLSGLGGYSTGVSWMLFQVFFFPDTMLMFFASVERSSYRNLLCSLSCVLQIVSHQIMVEILEYFFMQVPTCHN